MKTRKELLQDYLDDAHEALIKIEITMKYLQKRYAKNSEEQILQELAKLQSNEKETKDWVSFLEAELKGKNEETSEEKKENK